MAASHFTAPLVAAYLAYGFGCLCMRNHSRSVGDVSPVFGPYLTMYTGAAIVFDVGFLLYLFFRAAWWVPPALWVTGLLLNLWLFSIGDRLRIVDGLRALALACAGIVICPVAGYFMVRAALA